MTPAPATATATETPERKPPVKIRFEDVFDVLGSAMAMTLFRVLAKSSCGMAHLTSVTGLGQPNISRVLKLLKLVEIVEFTQAGRQVNYSLTPAGRVLAGFIDRHS